MKTENSELMNRAKQSLQGKWGLAIGTIVVYILIVVVLSVIVQLIPQPIRILGSIGSMFVSAPLALGLQMFVLSISRNRDAKLEQLFDGFSRTGVCVGAYLIRGFYTLLWMLLLIVPGIIAAISYSQTSFIIADDTSIGAAAAVDKSKAMMEGYKLKYFYLCLRFFGLILLCMLTLGIALLWLYPYMMVTMAKFYDDIKGEDTQGIPSFGMGKDQPLDAGIV